ncbi:DNA-processing protein DprA [Bacteroides sp. 51]|uniref:DNA-processing protein DprA n=1 Tax=Bacteroides sp. 51 TaxID=2302938 RepID=UPI0013D28322|nr:DNA-processing protein DprA [Bacteroides sp. 51]NDV80721.1 DNA-protecting protein DprA [Bacteroides sp. 51]
MSDVEQIYAIALTQVPGIGVVWGRNLMNAMGSAVDVFQRRQEIPSVLPGATQRVVDALNCPQAIARAEREYEFIQKNRIQCLTINDEAYPSRLRECDDAPIVLYFKGNTNLNATRIINMVGTRNATDYGKQICLRFLQDLKELCPDVLVVSGLAYGIDIHAHRAALQYDFGTVGVLAHGLDRIYPATHRKTAVEMLDKGGLLTEFITETTPDRYNFVSRNRIVAGMSDATIVVESASKGGSLITADLAQGYHRDCFAFPGRYMDTQSQGCNQLIQDNKAALIQSAEDFVKMMCWDASKQNPKTENVQRLLFPDLSEEESKIVSLLANSEPIHINNLVITTDIPVHRMNALLFELEMKGIIRVQAGNLYQLV